MGGWVGGYGPGEEGNHSHGKVISSLGVSLSVTPKVEKEGTVLASVCLVGGWVGGWVGGGDGGSLNELLVGK